MKPVQSTKSPEMEKFLESFTKNVLGGTREAQVNPENGEAFYLCATCGDKINSEKDFKDALSYKEFTISRMCQECQDSVFSGE
jgi:hypothetical protein